MNSIIWNIVPPFITVLIAGGGLLFGYGKANQKMEGMEAKMTKMETDHRNSLISMDKHHKEDIDAMNKKFDTNSLQHAKLFDKVGEVQKEIAESNKVLYTIKGYLMPKDEV